MTGAQRVIQALSTAGIRHLFALSGNQNLPLFDASIDSGIQILHTRHEAAAVHMADGWGRLTGQPGVALLTAGPGHCNGITGLFVARAAESPLLLLSGHSPLSQAGRGAFQELDQAAIATPVTKVSRLVTEPERVGDEIQAGLQLAASGRPGPVHLSLPMDLLQAEVADDSAEPAPAGPPVPKPPVPLAPADITAALADLCTAERPLILAGPAASRGDCWSAVSRLASAIRIPALPCESPRGVDDPWLRGAKTCLAQADVVLLVAKKLDFSLQFGEAPAFSPQCRFIRIDPDRQTPRVAVEQLIESSTQFDWPESDFPATVASARAEPADWRDFRRSTALPLHPLAVCEALQPFLDDRAVLVGDGGEFGQWVQAGLEAELRLINGPSGSIGSALPMGMAAKLCHPDRHVFVFLGDGTFGFHALEIDTCLRYGLPVVVIVGNDSRWNAEVQLQIRNYGADRLVGCDLLPTRYDRVATALGGHGEHVTQAGELAPAVERALATGLPSVLDVAIAGVPAPTF